METMLPDIEENYKKEHPLLKELEDELLFL
jgi:hypothetical protein